MVELDSGRNEALLPGFAVVGLSGHAYDISADGQQIVIAALDQEHKKRLWLAPLDRHSPPRQIPNLQGEEPMFGMPLFGPGDEILFLAYEGNSRFAYRVREDGTGLRKAIEQPIAILSGISPDRQWLVVKLPGKEGFHTAAFPLRGGSPAVLTAGGANIIVDARLQWSPDGRQIFIPLPILWGPFAVRGRTYAVPLRQRHVLPLPPTGGFGSEEDISKLPGAHLIDAFEATPGPTVEQYAFVRATVQRNLYRIPLP
jgi:eukaryotic-like serine/threonine-protein kinase